MRISYYITLSRYYITLNRYYITLSRYYITLGRYHITLSSYYITLGRYYITLCRYYITLSGNSYLSRIVPQEFKTNIQITLFNAYTSGCSKQKECYTKCVSRLLLYLFSRDRLFLCSCRRLGL